MVGFRSFLVGLTIIGIAAETAAAQFPFNPQRADPIDDVFLLAPRPLTRLLREGETAIQEMRYSEGITALFSLLLATDEELPADVRGQDYFLERGSLGLYKTSVKGEAIRLLSELPAEGRRTLEIQYGVAAKRELDAAIAARDFDAIGDVARRYVHTEAGYDAQVLLAQYKLTSGHPLAAAGLLKNLLVYPAARQRYGPQLALAAARAWMLAGNKETAGLTLKLAARDFPGASVTVGGEQLPLDVSTDWQSVLWREMDLDQPSINLATNHSWTTTGGSPERNALSSVGMPLKTERWVREIHSSLPEQEAIQRQSDLEKQRGRVLLPKFELRLVGNLVLTKTTDASLLAIDFDTGVIQWPLYFHSAPVPLTNFGYDSSGGDSSLSDELQNRVWGSSAFGKFSCDEQRLYFVSDKTDQILDTKTIFRASASSTESNFLEGASIQSQGAILWRVGGASGVDEPLLAGAYFLGPPLPFEGELYCIVEIRGETKLAVLDSTNGRVRWVQQLVQASSMLLRYDEERKSQALSPTIADGVILCPTGAGGVLAIDMLSRSLRWGATYVTKRQNINNSRFGAFGNAPEYEALAARWQEPCLIAQDGVVIITSPESEEFFCRDILTGVPQISQQQRGSFRYVAGLRDGRIVVIGEKHATALELGSSRTIWQCEFPEGLALAGKGIWQADSVLLPLTERHVIRIDTANGKIVEQTQVAQPLGNLFAHKDQLLSVSSSAVTVYYTREPLQRQVAERLAANSNDTWALNQQSQLAMADGNLQQALDALQKSIELDPSSADTRFLLVELLLTGLVENFKQFEDLAHKYEKLVELGPQQFRFLQQLALGKIRAGKHLAAFERLLTLIPKTGTTFAVSQNRERELELPDAYTVDSDAWIATELSRAYAQATASEKATMEKLVAGELVTIKNTMIPLRREKLRFLQWLRPANSALVDLAQAMLGGEEQVIAEQLLQPLLFADDPEPREIATALLKQPASSDMPNFGGLGQSLESQEAELKTNQAIANGEFSWNAGMVRAEESSENLYAEGATLDQVSERFGRPFLSAALSGSHVVVRSANGDSQAHLAFPGASSDMPNDSQMRANFRGGLLFIEKSSELAAFDTCRQMSNAGDALLWRQSLFSPGASPNSQFGIPELSIANTPFGYQISSRKQTAFVGPVTPVGVAIQVDTEIMLIDSLTGKKIWSRGGYDARVRMTERGLEIAVINPSLGAVEILDCRDGQLLRKLEYRGDWVHLHAHQGWVVEYTENQAIPPPPPTLRVWNAFSGEEPLKAELEEGTRLNFCEGRYLVIVEPSGKVSYFDFQNSERLLSQQSHINKPLHVESISVQRFEKRLVVVTSTNKLGAPLGEYKSANGPVFALDSETGELCWQQPGQLYDMLFPLSQPRESPFMVVFRIREVSRTLSLATLAMIDVRSGRIVYSNNDLPVRTSLGFSMRLRPDQQAVVVGIGAEIISPDRNYSSLKLVVTDEARPPQPIFSFGAPPTTNQSEPAKQYNFDDIFDSTR